MALSSPAAGNVLNKKIVYSTAIWRAAKDASVIMSDGNGLMGAKTTDASRAVHRITELTKTTGGTACVIPVRLPLVGDGTVGDAILTGNEEAVVNDAFTIHIDQLRHGVKSAGQLAEQEAIPQLSAGYDQELGFWRAEKVDELAILTLSGVAYTKTLDGATRSATSQWPTFKFASDVTSPSSNRVLYAGTATSTATLVATDKMSWSLLLTANARAKQRRIKPLMAKGSGPQGYAVLMHTMQGHDLKNDNDYKTAVSRAGQGGTKNPLFTGAFAAVDGLILFDTPKVYNTTGTSTKWGAATTVEGAQALLLGAQALGYGDINMKDAIRKADVNDYGNQQGVGYVMQFGFLKPVVKSRFDLDASGNFTSQDFGVISIYTAMTAAA